MRIHLSSVSGIEDMRSQIEAGGRFVAYQYIISRPVFMPVKRLSGVYFIGKDENPAKYSLGFNLLNILLGFWGLPMGPLVMYQSIRMNLHGGIDLTDDVMCNINEECFVTGRILLEKPAKHFLHPGKSNLQELEKVFRELSPQIPGLYPVVAGVYICTEKDEKPYHVIGISAEAGDKTVFLIKEGLCRRFWKSVRFEIICLNDTDHPFCERLRAEGVYLAD